jgi:glycosyltransferase involved in cell wall biosynthesis
MIPISVTILTKNSAKHLQNVLEALSSFEEVLLYDNGSEDETFSIADKFTNVRVERGPFLGFGPTHNRATSLAKHDWILSIDSDEVVTDELVDEIQKLQLNPQAVYSISRKNFYNGKWIKGCGWYPDRVARLYNRKQTSFTDAQVHEGVRCEGMEVTPLLSPMIHYSYDSTDQFISKMQNYSSLFAKQNSGKKSSLGKAILHGLAAFFKSYVIKRGFLDGREGFIISIYNGNTAFYKYLKLAEQSWAQMRRCPEEKASCCKSSCERQS